MQITIEPWFNEDIAEHLLTAFVLHITEELEAGRTVTLTVVSEDDDDKL